MLKPVIKIFNVPITAAGQNLSKSFDLEKNIKVLKGISLLSDKDDLMYYRGSQRIEINKEEIFPEGFMSKKIMCGINTPMSDRSYNLKNMNPGNGNIKITYQDTEDGRTVFAAYTVFLYLECDMEDGV